MRALPSRVGGRCARRARKLHQVSKFRIFDFLFHYFRSFFKSGLRRVEKRIPASFSAPPCDLKTCFIDRVSKILNFRTFCQFFVFFKPGGRIEKLTLDSASEPKKNIQGWYPTCLFYFFKLEKKSTINNRYIDIDFRKKRRQLKKNYSLSNAP